MLRKPPDPIRSSHDPCLHSGLLRRSNTGSFFLPCLACEECSDRSAGAGPWGYINSGEAWWAGTLPNFNILAQQKLTLSGPAWQKAWVYVKAFSFIYTTDYRKTLLCCQSSMTSTVCILLPSIHNREMMYHIYFPVYKTFLHHILWNKYISGSVTTILIFVVTS